MTIPTAGADDDPHRRRKEEHTRAGSAALSAPLPVKEDEEDERAGKTERGEHGEDEPRRTREGIEPERRQDEDERVVQKMGKDGGKDAPRAHGDEREAAAAEELVDGLLGPPVEEGEECAR